MICYVRSLIVLAHQEALIHMMVENRFNVFQDRLVILVNIRYPTFLLQAISDIAVLRV